MKKRFIIASMSMLLAASLVACGTGRSENVESSTDSDSGAGSQTVTASPGITDDTILLGSSVPLSGPASSYGVISEAFQAYLNKVNEEGGVTMGDGKTRLIKYINYDDAYTPDKTVANVRKLTDTDEVFAVVGIVGTPPNLAVRDYLNENKTPQIFSDSTSLLWGETEEYPWTRGWQPTMPAEASIYAKYIKENLPSATVAILSQNDDYGEEFVTAFESAIEGSGVKIVAHETYEVTDATVAPQVTKLSESQAEVFLDVSTTKATAQAITKQAELGWDTMHIINRISASIAAVLTPAGLDNSTGVVSTAYYKDPSSPEWQEDAAVKELRMVMEKAKVNPDDNFASHGWVMGELLVDALSRMKEPTRDSLMEAIDSFDGFSSGLMFDGVEAKTSKDDPFLIESSYLVRFDGDSWETISDLISVEGKSVIVK